MLCISRNQNMHQVLDAPRNVKPKRIVPTNQLALPSTTLLKPAKISPISSTPEQVPAGISSFDCACSGSWLVDVCSRCQRLRIACSVRFGRRSAMRFHRWPNSATLDWITASSSRVHDCRCSAPSRFTRGTVNGLHPAFRSRAHRLRTASSERPGNMAAIARQRIPSCSTPFLMASSSEAAHSLRLVTVETFAPSAAALSAASLNGRNSSPSAPAMVRPTASRLPIRSPRLTVSDMPSDAAPQPLSVWILLKSSCTQPEWSPSVISPTASSNHGVSIEESPVGCASSSESGCEQVSKSYSLLRSGMERAPAIEFGDVDPSFAPNISQSVSSTPASIRSIGFTSCIASFGVSDVVEDVEAEEEEHTRFAEAPRRP
mmetsp:Transcript_6758/g.16496  ORF Transcript_6758/g.16496 Transcript_6758/m.16496 type:complete len:374 (-) Transcript_6758:319-1440(-)